MYGGLRLYEQLDSQSSKDALSAHNSVVRCSLFA